MTIFQKLRFPNDKVVKHQPSSDMRLPFLIISTIFALLAAVKCGGHWDVCGLCPQPEPRCQCGIGKVSAVVGGLDARRNEFPWQVLLRITNREDNEYHCGGTVLNKGPFIKNVRTKGGGGWPKSRHSLREFAWI